MGCPPDLQPNPGPRQDLGIGVPAAANNDPSGRPDHFLGSHRLHRRSNGGNMSGLPAHLPAHPVQLGRHNAGWSLCREEVIRRLDRGFDGFYRLHHPRHTILDLSQSANKKEGQDCAPCGLWTGNHVLPYPNPPQAE